MKNLQRLVVLAWLLGPPLAAQDTLVVRADNPPVWGGEAKLVEELRIGRVDGPDHYTFGDITGFVVDDQGILWVADRLSATIRRYRPDGSHLDNIGRKGTGPGEFDGGYGISLARLSDGRVLAYDPLRGLAALSVFAPDGRYVRGMPLGLGMMIGTEFQLRVDSADVVYLLSGERADQLALGGGYRSLWIRLDSAGALLDTLRIPPADRIVRGGGRALPFGSMSPYLAQTVSALSPHGYLVTSRSDRYSLHRPVRDGRVLRIERTWKPVPASREEQAQYQARIDSNVLSSGGSLRNAVKVPSQKPPLWAIHVDDQGRIWVARHQPGFFRAEKPSEKERRENPELPVSVSPPIEWWEPLVTDVIEPNGRYLGTIAFPNNKTRIVATNGDTIWVIERGEFDEQYVARYRIEHK